VQNIIDAIVPIIVFIAVISGIINSIREATAKNSRPVPQPSQRSRAQAEMEAYLSGATPPEQAQTPPRQQRPVQQPQQAARQKQTARGKSQKKQSGAGAQPKKSQPLGSGLAQHVDSFIGDHVRSHMGRDVDAFVNKDIGERVKSNLGSQSSQAVEMSSSDTGSRAADDLLSVLKTRTGVHHAILVNEILSKPLSMRKR